MYVHIAQTGTCLSIIEFIGSRSSDLETIFSTVLSAHLSPCAEGDNDVANRLVQVAVQVHCQLSSLFLPSPDRQHYLFNLRHIAGLFRCTHCNIPLFCVNAMAVR